MRNKIAKKLRRLATKRVRTESNQYKSPDGSVRWYGQIREYKNLKRQWENSNIFEKKVLFNE